MSAAADFLAAIRTAEPMPLGPAARVGVLPRAEVDARVETFVASHPAAHPRAGHLRAAARLWHDDLDGSHELSQALDDPDGAWIHGIMHRREPDYDNAKYWFARVGRHPAFADLAPVAQRLGLKAWDADAVIDAVAAAEAGRRERAPLVAAQADEFTVLVAQLLR